MAKRKFASPFIIMSGWTEPGDDTWQAGGSAQGGVDYPIPPEEPSTPDVVAMTFNQWFQSDIAADLTGDGYTDDEDYEVWCSENGFEPDYDVG